MPLTSSFRHPVFFIAFLLQFLSFGTYFMEVSDGPTSDGPSPHIEPRINIVLTLLLTVVAFKVSISEQLPKVAKETQVDKYLVWSFVTLTSVAAEIFFLDNFADSVGSSRTSCDTAAFTTLFALWVVRQLFFFRHFYAEAQRKATLDQLEDEVDDLCEQVKAAKKAADPALKAKDDAAKRKMEQKTKALEDKRTELKKELKKLQTPVPGAELEATLSPHPQREPPVSPRSRMGSARSE
jgi:hypothetical protein